MTAAVSTSPAGLFAPAPRSGRTGLLAVARMLGEDLLSTLVYAGLFAATHSLALSTAVAIAAGAGGLAWRRLRGRPIDVMQGMSLALVVVFGGAGLILHDARFVMVKPTIAYLAVGCVMLKPGWTARYMPEIVRRHGADVVRGFELAWAGCMFATAAANLGFALSGDAASWARFVAVVPVASKLGLSALHYASVRVVVRRRVRAARAVSLG